MTWVELSGPARVLCSMPHRNAGALTQRHVSQMPAFAMPPLSPPGTLPPQAAHADRILAHTYACRDHSILGHAAVTHAVHTTNPVHLSISLVPTQRMAVRCVRRCDAQYCR
eukprot:83272-Rhodomonas_salina.3